MIFYNSLEKLTYIFHFSQGPRGIFQSCSYKSKKVNCGDIFKETVTDVGVCCSLRDSSNPGKLNANALLGLYDNKGHPFPGKVKVKIKIR